MIANMPKIKKIVIKYKHLYRKIDIIAYTTTLGGMYVREII